MIAFKPIVHASLHAFHHAPLKTVRGSAWCVCKSQESDSEGSSAEGDANSQELLARIAMLQTEKVRLTDFLEERSAYLSQFGEEAKAEFDKIGEDALKELDEAGARVPAKTSMHQRKNQIEYIPKAISEESSASEESIASETNDIVGSVKRFLVALYWFVYPYTMFGRTLSTISASLLAVDKLSDISSPLFFIGVLQALLPFTLMDFYVNGVNQLYDYEIDKINKPFLPLPSGAFSFTTGVVVTVSSAIMGFLASYMIGSWPLFWGLLSFFLTWSAYSIKGPFLRWKKNPVLAATCIYTTLALIFPISFFYHMKTFVLKRAVAFPKPLMFFVAFTSIYSLGIALFKDIPDIEGDKAFGIQSFSTRLGQKKVFWICISIFESAFGVAILAALSSSLLWVKLVMGVGNAVLASILWNQAKFVDLSDKASIRSYYMLIWKLLYVAYFLTPLIR